MLTDGIGRRQEFQNSWIYWHALTGAHNIQGGIRDKWIETGAERGPLGYPRSDEVVAPDGAGRFNRFERGMIYWSPNTGAHTVTGRILQVWSAAGYESSHYGYPTSDAVPATEPGAFIQQFQHGSIYVLENYLRALLVPAQGFASYDTGLHPAYCPDPLNSPPTCPVDLADYDTVPDPYGTLVTANLQKAAVVSAYFAARDRPNAHLLWEHYYENTGIDYALGAQLLDAWTSEDRTDYTGLRPPAEWVNANKEEAISTAIAETAATGQPAKVIISTPWQTTAGISNDQVQSIGRYSLCSTTAAIAQPGNPGQNQIELRQQTHIYDVYDFAAGDDYGNPANDAVAVAVEGEKLGIAKPFLVLGSSSVHTWSGIR
ncbi:LGFP repeat-containing protein [Nocardia fluminea]|uniref:LGFP repeat-containing protein n=1 Tax=Nocardia fluminea TaxID=134984 RepID=UPI00343C0C85